MQFEDLDNKVRQAAEQHHPNYDEKAWAKMEKLLNRHLPQKEDRRRRIIFFLLFLLLLGGGIWVFINKPWQQNRLTKIIENNNQHKKQQDAANIPAKDETLIATQDNSSLNAEQDKTSVPDGKKLKELHKQDSKNTGSFGPNLNSQGKNQKAKTAKKKFSEIGFKVQGLPANAGNRNKTTYHVIKEDKSKNKTSSPVFNTIIASPGNNNDNNKVRNDNTYSQSGLPVISDRFQTKTDPAKKDTIIAEQPLETKEKTIARKSRSNKTNSFFFSFSAGPDISSVGLNNPGKVRLLTGAGLGYIFKDRWTIRTGFYSVRKIYKAAPVDYKPSVPLTNTIYLKNISADCKVYEIPLSLTFNFGRSEKHVAFAALGLSSFIMKKETYKYKYVYPAAPPYYYTHTEDNKYKHYFSVLALSGGYRRKISRVISIMAEPYFKIPLAGVGYGKLKLNSAGILFSLNISPFQPVSKK